MVNNIKYILFTAAISMAACVFGTDFICADRECTLLCVSEGMHSETNSAELGTYDDYSKWFYGDLIYSSDSYTVVKTGYECDWYTLAADSSTMFEDKLENCQTLLKQGSSTITSAEIAASARKTGDTSKSYLACARLSPAKYKVKFDGNGGNSTRSYADVFFDTNYVENVESWPTATREGYDFGGWFTAKDGGNEILWDTKVSTPSNHTLYAHWNARHYKVTLYPGDGATVDPEEFQVTFGGTYAGLPDPVRPGSVFRFWTVGKDGGTQVYATNVVTTARDHDLYAQWSEIVYEVTLDPCGGEFKTPFTNPTRLIYNQEYGNGTSGLLPTNMEKEGFVFEGWYDVDGLKIENTTKFTMLQNATIYAHWKAIEYTVKFVGGEGSEGEMEPQGFAYGEAKALSPCAFTKLGLDFVNWKSADGDCYTDGQVVSNLTSVAGGEVVLTAQWPSPTYIRFVAPSATGEMEIEHFEGDEAKPLTSNAFERVGYAFDHWTNLTGEVFFDGQYVTNSLYVAVAQTNTLHAVWSNNVYTISFNGNGATNSMESVTAVYDVPMKLCNGFLHPDKVAKFIGWGLSSDTLEHPLDSGKDYATVTNLASVSGADVTLFARWSVDYGPLSAALDCDNLRFETDNGYWHVVDDGRYGAPYSGGTYLANDSGYGPHELYATGLIGSGTLRFMVNTEYDDIELAISVDENPIMTFSGATCPDWQSKRWAEVSVRLSDMTADQRLCFSHDAGGMDYCAIDDLSWTPDSEPPEPPTTVTNSVPTAVAGLVYDGTAQTGVAGGDNYTITGNVATNAGEYTAVATVTNGVWEGGFGGPTNIAWTIAKAVYDMSGVGFSGATFEEDGSAKSIFISGDLPAGVTVEYTGNGVSAPGDYTVTAKFSGDAVNYEAIPDKTATLTITAKTEPPEPPTTVTNSVPTAVAGLVYDGTAQTGVAGGDNYTITGNVATNAGEYTAVATVTNGVWEGGFGGPTNIAWTIAKAVYDMSGVGFSGATFEEDGSAKSIFISGDLPAGVTVEYTGNGVSAPGDYTVTAKFSGDAVNYEAIPDKTATLTITAKTDPSELVTAYENISFDATLEELGVTVPTDRKITIKAEGLPKGLKLVTTALKDANGKANGSYAYTVVGAPTETMDGESRIAYVRVTDNKVQTLYALDLRVLPASEYESKAFPDGEVKAAYVNFSVTNLWPEVAAEPQNWTFSGFPSGIRYTAKAVKDAAACEIYGTPTKAGRFTVKAVEKIAGTTYKSTHVASFTVWPDSQGSATEWIDQAYVPVDREADPAVTAASGLPAGVKFTAKDIAASPAHRFYGTPTKAGAFVVTLTNADRSKSQFVWTVTPASAPDFELNLTETSVDPSTEKAVIRVGVEYGWTVDVTEGATVTASGLPTGMKLVKTPVKNGTKIVGYLWSVSGVPTKAGEFFATFTTKLNGVSTVKTTAFTVLDLPAWAQGTFDGGADESFPASGQVTFTVSKAGKLSGKWMSDGANWTLSAAAYDRYDDSTTGYVARIVGKTGSGAAAVVFTNELTVTEDAVGGSAECESFLAWQNPWKVEPWKTLGKNVATSAVYEYRPYPDAGNDHTNDTVSLKFSATGKITVKASYFKSVSSLGRITWTTASGSAVLCPTCLPVDGRFDAVVFVYLPPKKGTPTEESAYSACVWLRWTGTDFVKLALP